MSNELCAEDKRNYLENIMTPEEIEGFLHFFPKGDWKENDIPSYIREREKEEIANDHIQGEVLENQEE